MAALQAIPSATPISSSRALFNRPRRANSINNRVIVNAPTMASALSSHIGIKFCPSSTAITKATPAPLETPSSPGSAGIVKQRLHHCPANRQRRADRHHRQHPWQTQLPDEQLPVGVNHCVGHSQISPALNPSISAASSSSASNVKQRRSRRRWRWIRPLKVGTASG